MTTKIKNTKNTRDVLNVLNPLSFVSICHLISEYHASKKSVINKGKSLFKIIKNVSRKLSLIWGSEYWASEKQKHEIYGGDQNTGRPVLGTLTRNALFVYCGDLNTGYLSGVRILHSENKQLDHILCKTYTLSTLH